MKQEVFSTRVTGSHREAGAGVTCRRYFLLMGQQHIHDSEKFPVWLFDVMPRVKTWGQKPQAAVYLR